jgi:hypothetical protein
MKKIFYCVLVLIPLTLFGFPCLTSAQEKVATDKGVYSVGGLFSISRFTGQQEFPFSGFSGTQTVTLTTTTTQYLFNPKLDFFIANQVSLGISGTVLYNSSSFTASGGTTLTSSSGSGSTSAFGLGSSLAYYFTSAKGETSLPFVSGGFNLIHFAEGSGTTSLRFDVGVGNTFLVSKNVGITGRVYYSVEPFDNPIVHILGIQFGVSTFIF